MARWLLNTGALI